MLQSLHDCPMIDESLGQRIRAEELRILRRHYAAVINFSTPAFDIALSGEKPGISQAVFGSSWTTDAPFFANAAAIEAARSNGCSSSQSRWRPTALNTFARVTGSNSSLCLGACDEIRWPDGPRRFEKGEADGTVRSSSILKRYCRATLAEEVCRVWNRVNGLAFCDDVAS